jgi:hypothetical protein
MPSPSIAEGSEKAIRINHLIERRPECNAAFQDARRMQIGCSNIGMIKPAAHFGEVIGDRERTAPGDFNAPHQEPSLVCRRPDYR